EAKQLLGYRGDPAQLRRLEQDDMSASYHGERSWELLPFSVLSPSAQQRLQLGLLQRELQGRAEELHRGFQ
ncbi:unnamed protein product, partial [Durusdinium trenchii]